MVPNSNNLIAFEWDKDEVRYVWAGQAARRLVIRAIGRIANAELGDGELNWEEVLREVKQRLRAKNSRAIAVLPRSDVEEFEATLPPAEMHELSGLIANEAHKHLANADESRLDFLEMESAPDATRRVVITALPPAAFNRISAGVKQVGWKLASIQMRHVAVAGIVRKLIELSQQPRSIAVSLNRSDAELIIFDHEKIILVRSIPLASENDPVALADRLAVEIQRSLMVTGKAESADGVADRLFVLGNAHEQQVLADQLTRVLNLTVNVINPIDSFIAFPKDLPSGFHHFSGLLGSLIEQPAEVSVDLINSKCGRPKRVWLQRAIVYGSAAALLLMAGGWWALQTVADSRGANLSLKQELTKLEKQLEQLENRVAVVDQIEAWNGDNVNWLDELRELSQRFPERSLLQVKSMTLSSGSTSPGVISMNLQAKNENVITQLEQAIRDDFHQVRTNQFSQSESDEELPWQFGATILVERRDRDEFAPITQLPSEKSEPAPPATGQAPIEAARTPGASQAGGTE